MVLVKDVGPVCCLSGVFDERKTVDGLEAIDDGLWPQEPCEPLTDPVVE